MSRRVPLASCVAALGLAGLLAPAGAGASSAFIAGAQLRYNAAAAEDNSLTISREGNSYRVVDPGAVISPIAPECVASAPGVLCTPGPAGLGSIVVDLGDLDDDATVGDSVTEIGVIIHGRAGADTINGSNFGFDTLTGDDSLDPPSTDTINARGGSDTLDGGPGDDVLNGGDDDDFSPGEPGNDIFDGGAGDDFVGGGSLADGGDTIIGGPGRDGFSYSDRQGLAPARMIQNNLPDDGFAGEGDNIRNDVENLGGGRGDDTISAGAIQNRIFGDQGDDVLSGGGGDDLSVRGGEGDDTVRGGAGDEQAIAGDGGADRLEGGPGDDFFPTGAFEHEPDVIRGGAGTDSVDYSNAHDPVRVSLDNRANDGIATETDNIRSDVENVTGTSYSDRLVGSNAANQFTGLEGRDILIGGRGNDGLDGGAGGDNLSGGKGIDSFYGGSGSDKIAARDGGRDAASCGSGNDLVTADRARLDRTDLDCERIRRPRRR